MISPWQSATTGTMTAEEEVIGRVMVGTLPQLRSMLAEIESIQRTWLVNGISAKIEQAKADGVPLAGYSPAVWDALGVTLTEVMQHMNAVSETTGKTPIQVIETRYTREQTA